MINHKNTLIFIMILIIKKKKYQNSIKIVFIKFLIVFECLFVIYNKSLSILMCKLLS